MSFKISKQTLSTNEQNQARHARKRKYENRTNVVVVVVNNLNHTKYQSTNNDVITKYMISTSVDKNLNMNYNPSQTKINLTKLLYLREISHGKYSTTAMKQILKGKNDDTNSWKERYLHRISFEALNTSWDDAILSIDRTGFYMFGIGSASNSSTLSNDTNAMEENVLLRFYAIPSRSRLETIQRNQKHQNVTTTSPLLMSIPLYCWKKQDEDNRFSYYGTNTAITNFPIQILTSSDAKVGISIVHHSSSTTQNDESLSTITIFPLPSSNYINEIVTTSYQCCNIRFGTKFKSICNLLWPVCCIPKGGGYTWTDYGYLYVNDEDDGFRFTWIDTFYKDDGSSAIVMEDYEMKFKERTALHFITQDDTTATTWEKVQSLCSNGKIIKNKFEKGQVLQKNGDLYIANELYLHIHLLLHDILSLHPKLFPTISIIPEYTYNLISVLNQGKDIILAIVFQNPNKKVYYGIILNINIIQKTYIELQWVQKKATDVPHTNMLYDWCNTLCVHYRKIFYDAPFVTNVDSVDLLYTQCNSIQNNAVTNGRPVTELNCLDMPIQIYYDL